MDHIDPPAVNVHHIVEMLMINLNNNLVIINHVTMRVMLACLDFLPYVSNIKLIII